MPLHFEVLDQDLYSIRTTAERTTAYHMVMGKVPILRVLWEKTPSWVLA